MDQFSDFTETSKEISVPFGLVSKEVLVEYKAP